MGRRLVRMRLSGVHSTEYSTEYRKRCADSDAKPGWLRPAVCSALYPCSVLLLVGARRQEQPEVLLCTAVHEHDGYAAGVCLRVRVLCTLYVCTLYVCVCVCVSLRSTCVSLLVCVCLFVCVSCVCLLRTLCLCVFRWRPCASRPLASEAAMMRWWAVEGCA